MLDVNSEVEILIHGFYREILMVAGNKSITESLVHKHMRYFLFEDEISDLKWHSSICLISISSLFLNGFLPVIEFIQPIY